MRSEIFNVAIPLRAPDRWRHAKVIANRKARDLIEGHGWQGARITLLHPETLQVRTTKSGERLECYEFEIVEVE